MKKFTLIKMSAPGWDKEYDSEQDCRDELAKWVCRSCIDDECDGREGDLYELLGTSCGAEFFLEETDD